MRGEGIAPPLKPSTVGYGGRGLGKSGVRPSFALARGGRGAGLCAERPSWAAGVIETLIIGERRGLTQVLRHESSATEKPPLRRFADRRGERRRSNAKK
jgi:hypothetical protein